MNVYLQDATILIPMLSSLSKNEVCSEFSSFSFYVELLRRTVYVHCISKIKKRWTISGVDLSSHCTSMKWLLEYTWQNNLNFSCKSGIIQVGYNHYLFSGFTYFSTACWPSIGKVPACTCSHITGTCECSIFCDFCNFFFSLSMITFSLTSYFPLLDMNCQGTSRLYICVILQVTSDYFVLSFWRKKQDLFRINKFWR